MANYKISSLIDEVAETIGEGPFWEPVTKTLFFVSIIDGKVHTWNDELKQHTCTQIGQPDEPVSFVIPCEKGGFLAGVSRKIVHYDWHQGQLQLRTLHEVEHGEPTRFNDAKCDPAGRLLAGTMSLEVTPGTPMKRDAGSLYGMDEVGVLNTFDSGFTVSNGLGWLGSKMYFVESSSKKIYAYDWDSENFSATNRQVAVDYKNLPGAEQLGVPDGLTVDANGHLWVCCFFGSRVLQIDPEAGKLISQIPMPVANVTSCCFGGANMDELFVTSAARDPAQPMGGSLFKITGLGVKGAPSVAYKGNLPMTI